MNLRQPALVGGLLLNSLLATTTTWGVEADSRAAALQSITRQEVSDHVGALADDTFEGRESGSRGNRAAGVYIVERLKKYGLQGAGPKKTFYQSFGTYNNILASFEGSDPELKEQVIVIGAHYDHVGYGNSRNSLGPTGFIHNGADDNASGVSGLLEVAEAVSLLPERPKRTILFAFWDGEERGLVGSQHWAGNPSVPLDRVPIVLNVDMIGRLRDDHLIVYGARTSRGLRKIVSRQNDVTQLGIEFNWDLKADSDHHSFVTRDVPVLMLFTGLHNDYHRPSDDAEKINHDGLMQVSRLLFNVLVELADAPSLGKFRGQARQESSAVQKSLERPLAAPPGRLGIRWDEPAAAEGKVIVASVSPSSAAEKGGVRTGDRIMRLAGNEITDLARFRVVLLAAENPVSVMVERSGETEPRELTLELPGEPTRLGIGWRVDDAEPDSIFINRVTPGSRADLAGLKAGERILRIDGQDFADAEAFRKAATAATGPILLDVEANGKVRSVEIPSLE